MGIVTQKKCIKCGEWKNLDQFSKHKASKDGHLGTCKTCASSIFKAWRQKNLEHEKQRSRDYYYSDPEKQRARVRKYRSDNLERVQEGYRNWLANNPDKARESSNRWKLLNWGKVLEYARQYRSNTERRREQERRYINNHREQIRAKNRNRQALRKGAGGKVTAQEWHALKEFYNHTCLCCGRSEPEIRLTQDHILPLSLGGMNTIDNVQPLCVSCNSSKQDKYIDYRKDF